MTFTIKGNPRIYSIWKKINDISAKRLRKNGDLVIDVNSISLPTPSSLLIKFTKVNTGKKYELVFQGKYSEIYKKVSDGFEVSALVHAKQLISDNITKAFEIN